ncbi:MAG: hypothetical protein J7L34_02685, partial [Thermotogaceae bacterium]|nr:hypothetical protein [Thermotogaceae bacterium]
PSFSENTYKNTRKLRNFLKKILGPYRSESLSPSRTSEIVTGKTSFIRSDTLQKLIEGKDIDIYTCPYPVYNELIKKRIKKDFEKAIMTLQGMKFKDRLCLFLSTFTALVDRSKFYLSRKDKFLEAFMLLKRKKDIPRFKEYMSKRYETMLFVINMIEPHPYIKGRRDAAKKFFSRLSSKRLETFAKVYASLREGNRKVIDRFLRNYGRYEVMRLRTRLKGPKVIRDFAKRYGAKVQPTLAAYWTNSDGRVRRKLEIIFSAFLA